MRCIGNLVTVVLQKTSDEGLMMEVACNRDMLNLLRKVFQFLGLVMILSCV